MPGSLAERLLQTPYAAYSYSYPHKTAYRPLPQPVPLGPLWEAEDRRSLFLYLHVPFCTYRCGFCNLFALARPGDARVAAYVEQLLVQMAVVADTLGAHRVVRLAVGGGTPSYLEAAQLERVFDAAARRFRFADGGVPGGVEVSPETATRERLAVCRAAGITRVSMGVQSFADAEVRALVRPQQREVVVGAIETIRALGFPTLNLDLIYGIAGQSSASFLASIDAALVHAPEELYLYPLYVRPQTGLDRAGDARGADHRLALYRAGRDRLLAAGYQQVSMRMFRAPQAPTDAAPVYCCQDDGMVGLGCGARSYTRGLHYAWEYGVKPQSVRALIDDWLARPARDFEVAGFGAVLDGDEQRRRYVIQSLLLRDGLDRGAYVARFGSAVETDLPQLEELLELDLAIRDERTLRLTDEGLARSDAIGPWLVSPAVAERMRGHALHPDDHR